METKVYFLQKSNGAKVIINENKQLFIVCGEISISIRNAAFCLNRMGAGRLLARGKVKQELSMDQFKSDMDGIYTTCVSQSTLDESPAAYKNTDVIVAAIHHTVDIKAWIKPVYNFKASE